MRLNCFEQLLFWYIVIENNEVGSCDFLEIILDEKLVTEFMEYYCVVNVETDDSDEDVKDTASSTMANHYGNYAAFVKWMVCVRDLKEHQNRALTCWLQYLRHTAGNSRDTETEGVLTLRSQTRRRICTKIGSPI